MNATVIQRSMIHPPISSTKVLQNWPLFKPKLLASTTAFKCRCCIKNEETQKSPLGFSLLKSDMPCKRGSLWSTMAVYIFSLHIPLSFGGVPAVASILHLDVVDPQTQALSITVLQIVEFIGFFLLLRFSENHQMELSDIFNPRKLPNERSWLLASLVGAGFLVITVFLTSILADELIGPKDVNNPVLKDILSSGSISGTACVMVYCVVTPILEETVYRGYLLTSLCSMMNWQPAVVISSFIFSAAHFSGENFIQLFIIGIVLGCSYCWSANLRSSIVIHSLYNALILYVTYVSQD